MIHDLIRTHESSMHYKGTGSEESKMAVTALSLKEGGKRWKVIVGVAAVINIIVLCVGFALMWRIFDERERNRPIPSKLGRQFWRVINLKQDGKTKVRGNM